MHSWIPKSFAWREYPSTFCVVAPIDDPSIVELVSKGYIDVTVMPRQSVRVWSRAFPGLESTLNHAVWMTGQLRPEGRKPRLDETIRAYLHGTFNLPDYPGLAMLVGRAICVAPLGITGEGKLLADRLYNKYIQEVDAAKFEREQRDRENERIIGKASGKEQAQLRHALYVAEAMRPRIRPTANAVSLLGQLTKGIAVKTSAKDPLRIERLAAKLIDRSTMAPPRDGAYVALSFDARSSLPSIVTWEPSASIPSYPEVRWAVQRRLPSALRKPRESTIAPPSLDDLNVDSGRPIEVDDVNTLDIDDPSWIETLVDATFDFRDFRDRVETSDARVMKMGFEAIAWFQPYHSWTEHTWGIYFDAQKVDDLACSLFDSMRNHLATGSSQGLAAQLAVGLVYEHEIFHAKVEAALSWAELTAFRPVFRRYYARVYQVLRGTPEWLEEALANWQSAAWARGFLENSVSDGRLSDSAAAKRAVEATLDMSPPGYRDWRRGNDVNAWRTLARQMLAGRPTRQLPSAPLPLETILRGPLQFDLQPKDIPIRFVGSGTILNHLLSYPATFGVPSRKELTLVLKSRGYRGDPSAGKGSHEKWTGPDNKAFLVPYRDPVSRTVFGKFLHHLDIDKATYVTTIRPNL